MLFRSTSLNKQGNDRGPQYRTGIYFRDAADRQTAETVLKSVQAGYPSPIVTELQPLALKKRFAQDPKKYDADPAANPSFSAYEATVRRKTVEDLTKAKIDEISKFAADQLGLSQRSLKRKNSYFVLPDDWSRQMPSFAGLATAIAGEFGVPAPIVQTSGDAAVAIDTVAALPGIGAFASAAGVFAASDPPGVERGRRPGVPTRY